MRIEELESVVGAPARKRQKMDASQENTVYASPSLSSRKSSKQDEKGTLRWPRESYSKRDVPNIPKLANPKHLIPDVDGILVSDDEDDSMEQITCSSNKRYFQHALYGVVAHRSIAGVMPQPCFGRPLPLPPNLPSVPAGFKFTPALIR